MKTLYLADLEDMDEKQLKEHIAMEYGEEKSFEAWYDKDGNKKKDEILYAYLKGCKFLIAHEEQDGKKEL